jgi:hypothetical protein
LTSVLGAVATRDRGQNVARRYRLEVTPVILSRYRLRIAISLCSFSFLVVFCTGAAAIGSSNIWTS